MEMGEHTASTKLDTEVIPSLLEAISTIELAGFDTIIEGNENETETSTGRKAEFDSIQSQSYSVPATPTGLLQTPRKVYFNDHPIDMSVIEIPPTENIEPAVRTKYYSQPMPKAVPVMCGEGRSPNGDRLRDTRFDSFKTWSGRLERQLSHLRGKATEPEPERSRVGNDAEGVLPVDRYFDALEGPELDTLRPSEQLMLPDDKTWPFLLRFPVSAFGICLGVSSQAILWKTLASSPSTSFLHVSPIVNMVLWYISLALVIAVTIIYVLKITFYFEAVRREYYHPIRVNFFFAPFIALLFLLLGIPPSVTTNLHHAIWYVFMVPFLCLELKIYGQWMSGGQRRLSKVANPSNHLSVVGNFVGALLGASMGLKEGPLFFFAIGLAHYTVLFVTLYQRLPTNETLPKDLHPVFFLFVAAPSVASMAWAKIQGSFDYGARIAYFIALFLYFSLAVRINFFRGIRFSLAWWAYTFPMTGAAIATIRYSNEVTSGVTQAMAIILSAISTLTVTGLLITTLLQAFVFRNLFPNDVSIAISDRAPKPHKRWFHLRNISSDGKDIENYLKFESKDDLEAST
ncbi:S-type anion channel SLAH3-like [Silene latifolia]|uniref:S-type anion channel SLAH3-like n=1 Tax=Silene latifolia TaxID=37657 RepID=UPI003D7798D6